MKNFQPSINSKVKAYYLIFKRLIKIGSRSLTTSLQKNSFQQALKSVIGFLAVLIAGCIGLYGILYLANGGLIFGLGLPKSDKPSADGSGVSSIQALTPIVACFGGVVGLWTFFLNREQKERHAREEERRERDLAELQRLEAEFAALAEDFAKDDDGARINAAIGFGEIAQKADPRMVGKELARRQVRVTINDGEEIISDFPDYLRSQKNPQVYPYFLRAFNRLVASLRVWESQSAIAESVRVMKEIVYWAKDEGTDELLLHEVCNLMASANKTAWNLICERLQHHKLNSCQKNRIATAASIEYAKHVNVPISIYEFEAEIGARLSLELISEDEDVSNETILEIDRINEENIAFHVRCFCLSSEILCFALQTLSQPPDWVPFEDERNPPLCSSWVPRLAVRIKAKKYAKEPFFALGWLLVRRNLQLTDIVLFGPSLIGANLHCADLSRAKLLGGVVTMAKLPGAILENASFKNTQVHSSIFSWTNLFMADFKFAGSATCNFDWAFAHSTIFRETVLSGSSFRMTYLRLADFVASECLSADFSGAYLAQSVFRRDPFRPADTGSSDFSKAVFTLYGWRGWASMPEELSFEDVKLRQFLLGESKETSFDWDDGNDLPAADSTVIFGSVEPASDQVGESDKEINLDSGA